MSTTSTDFHRKAYWENRLSEEYSLAGTGSHGLGVGYNKWVYRIQRQNFLSTLQPLVPGRSDLRVLDVGSGTGFFVDRWHEFGVSRVRGSDITATAVAGLSARSPNDRFVQLDIGGEDLSPLEGARFDLVSACAVLYHVVDDDAYERAFHNVASCSTPAACSSSARTSRGATPTGPRPRPCGRRRRSRASSSGPDSRSSIAARSTSS
jgi:SAM-dependent methyltransferase